MGTLVILVVFGNISRLIAVKIWFVTNWILQWPLYSFGLADYLYCSIGYICSLQNFHPHTTDIWATVYYYPGQGNTEYLSSENTLTSCTCKNLCDWTPFRTLGWGQIQIRQRGNPFTMKRSSTPSKRGQIWGLRPFPIFTRTSRVGLTCRFTLRLFPDSRFANVVKAWLIVIPCYFLKEFVDNGKSSIALPTLFCYML